jgi:hypothetical protein
MKSNRTSSFPADRLSRPDLYIVIAFAIAVPLMAAVAIWTLTQLSVPIGIFLVAVAVGEAVIAVLYYRAAKRKNNSTAGT